MLKQIANEVWKKCMTEISKDDNKQILDNYIYKPVNNTLSEVKMYFILLIVGLLVGASIGAFTILKMIK